MNTLKSQVGGTHYCRLPMQPFELIFDTKADYWKGNIIKYVTRYKDKNGREDLEKAIHYNRHLLWLFAEKNYVPISTTRYGNEDKTARYCLLNSLDAWQHDAIIMCLDGYFLKSIEAITKGISNL